MSTPTELSLAFEVQLQAVLDAMVDADGGVTPMEVSRRVGLPISKGHKDGKPIPWLGYALLYHLLGEGLVTRPKKGRYTLAE